jgi:hypothetical protein
VLSALGASAAAALSFTPPVDYDVGGRPADIASADVNGDGRLDIVASAGVGLAILIGREQGRFAPATRIALEHRPAALALADINGDGTVDVVTPNADDTITLTGKHVGVRGAVQFGGKTAATGALWSPTRIKFTVPRGTPKGRVKVTVTTVVGRSAARSFTRL